MANQQPTYQTRQARKPDDFWLNIGAAFMHQDGEGFNIVLQALPINGKIVLHPHFAGSKPAKQNQDQQNYDHKAEAATPVVAGTVKWAATDPTQAA